MRPTVLAQATAPCVFFDAPNLRFHPASGIDEAVVAQMQADLRRRILRAFVGRGLIESCDAKEMLAYQHSGFSVDASVRIEAQDRDIVNLRVTSEAARQATSPSRRWS